MRQSKFLIDLCSGSSAAPRIRQGLVPALEELGDRRGLSLDFCLRAGWNDVAPRGKVHRVPAGADFTLDEVILPRLAHSYAGLYTQRETCRLPARRGWRAVIQIHEHWKARGTPTSGLRPRVRGTVQAFRFAQIYRRADCILFSSHWTKEDCRHRLGRLPRTYRVAPLGAWPDDSLPRSPQPAQQYVAVVASADRRDSESWGMAAWRAAALGPQWRLVVLGRSDGQWSGPNVHRMGYLSDADFRNTLAGAAAYLHIGEVEGFGESVLEALQLGVPVVARRGSAVDELAGSGGGYLVGSGDEAGVALAKVIRQPALRAEAHRVGQQFSWRVTAEAILNALSALRR